MVDQRTMHEALNGGLGSSSEDILSLATFENRLDVPVSLYWLDWEGRPLTAAAGVAQGVSGQFLPVEAHTTLPLRNARGGHYVLLTASIGPFVCTLEA